MILTLDDLKKKHDKAFNANQTTREQASDDLIFYHVTQWDDQLLGDSQLQYRGEFNILRKAGRQILSSLASNPVQPDFHPKDESRKDDAEIMDQLYRADDRGLDSQEAYEFAKQESVVCGFGAWEIYTEYATNKIGDDNQVVMRRHIPEANNTCFWDPNDNSISKKNANYCSILHRYSYEGYEELVRELTGDDDYKCSQKNFKEPEQSYTFPWSGGGESEKVYVATFYHRYKVKDKVLTLESPFGDPLFLREMDIEEAMDDLLDSGYKIVAEKEIMRWQVRKYIASGEMILNGNGEGEVVCGEFIPVVPVYGEYVPQVEGESYWSGVTRLAKDPQRLRNFQMSYLADIVSRSPRVKPIFYPEQIQGFELMYEETGADNNYPYYLQHRTDPQGNQLPIGAVATMPEQPIPQALAASIELSRQAVEDVANPGIPQDVADPDLSGKAVYALQNRIDMQDYVYQDHFKHAKKRDAEIYASIASEIYDTPRPVTVQSPDGTVKQIQLMEIIIDKETGEPVVLNDLTNMEFDVYSDVGVAYETQKQQTIDQLTQIATSVAQTDPVMHKILSMKILEILPGVQFDDVRDYVRKQLIVMGIKEPETEEDMQALQQAAMQGNQPDANTLMAMAEQAKADAAQMEVQRKMIKDQYDAQLKSADLEIKAYGEQTDRAEQEVKAFEVGANVSKTLSEKNSIDIDNQLKTVTAMFSARGMM